MNKKNFLILLIFIINFAYSSELRIITNEEPPTNYLNKNEIDGISVDVVEELIKEQKLNTKIELMTWARAYEIGKQNENIGLFTAGRTFQRIQEGFSFLGPIITKQAVLYKNRNNHIEINTLLDIKKHNLKIGAMRGDWRADYFKDKGFDVYEVSNHEQNLQKLLLKRIDLWAISKIEAQFITQKANIDLSKIDIAYKFQDISSFLMFSKGTSKQTIRDWENAYRNLQKTDFFEKTAKKWSILLKIDLEYDRYKGFYVK